MFPDNSKFSSLQQEGYLTRSCLYTGLLALNKANLSDKGDFYVAFFQLSIGLERLLKLTLILDYMATNELIPPDTKKVRSYSHDLVKLFGKVGEIEKCVSNRVLIKNILESQSSEYDILVFLRDFAEGTRYANLNALTGIKSILDPLDEWNKITMRVVAKDVPQEIKQMLTQHSIAINKAMRPNATIVFDDLEKKPPSPDQAWWLGSMFKMVAPYTIWRIMKIIYPVYRVMNDVCQLAQNVNTSLHPNKMIIPVMYEFFGDFVFDDEDFVVNLEQWLKNA